MNAEMSRIVGWVVGIAFVSLLAGLSLVKRVVGIAL